MKVKIIVSILCVMILSASAFSADNNEKDTRSFWGKLVDTILYPLEKLHDMIRHTPRTYTDDIFSDDPERSREATDRYVEEWQEIPQDMGWVTEEGIEELSGPIGVIKDAKDFYGRWGKKYQPKPGLRQRERKKKEQGLDAELISRIYSEMDQEKAERRRKQLEEAQQVAEEIDETLENSAGESVETPASPKSKKRKHPCKISRSHPECQRIIRKAINEGLRQSR